METADDPQKCRHELLRRNNDKKGTDKHSWYVCMACGEHILTSLKTHEHQA